MLQIYSQVKEEIKKEIQTEEKHCVPSGHLSWTQLAASKTHMKDDAIQEKLLIKLTCPHLRTLHISCIMNIHSSTELLT